MDYEEYIACEQMFREASDELNLDIILESLENESTNAAKLKDLTNRVKAKFDSLINKVKRGDKNGAMKDAEEVADVLNEN